MDTALVIALASLLSALGAVAAAMVAVLTLRAQQNALARQHNLDNYWRITDGWWAIRGERAAAARSILDGKPAFNEVRLVLNYLERTAHLARTGEITPETVQSVLGFATAGWLDGARTFIDEMRTSVAAADLWEDLEWFVQHGSSPNADWLASYLDREATEQAPAVRVKLVDE